MRLPSPSFIEFRKLTRRREEETLKYSDGHPALAPKNIYTFLANLFYSRRSRINPLWNACLVGGWDFEKDEP